MALLLDELLEIYHRFSDEDDRYSKEDFDYPHWAANYSALTELGAAICSILDPKTVGDVMALPDDRLRNEGLAHLIRRDAADHYDQVEGFISEARCEAYLPLITPSQHGFNGLALCQWVLQIFPLDT